MWLFFSFVDSLDESYNQPVAIILKRKRKRKRELTPSLHVQTQLTVAKRDQNKINEGVVRLHLKMMFV